MGKTWQYALGHLFSKTTEHVLLRNISGSVFWENKTIHHLIERRGPLSIIKVPPTRSVVVSYYGERPSSVLQTRGSDKAAENFHPPYSDTNLQPFPTNKKCEKFGNSSGTVSLSCGHNKVQYIFCAVSALALLYPFAFSKVYIGGLLYRRLFGHLQLISLLLVQHVCHRWFTYTYTYFRLSTHLTAFGKKLPLRPLDEKFTNWFDKTKID